MDTPAARHQRAAVRPAGAARRPYQAGRRQEHPRQRLCRQGQVGRGAQARPPEARRRRERHEALGGQRRQPRIIGRRAGAVRVHEEEVEADQPDRSFLSSNSSSFVFFFFFFFFYSSATQVRYINIIYTNKKLTKRIKA